MPSAAELVDGDLVLREWRGDEDVEAVGYTQRSPEIGEFFGLPSSGELPPLNPDAPRWAIVENGVPVGRIWTVGAGPLEVGYYLRPDAWGRGLATRSLILVRDYLGGPLRLCTHPRNERSQRVAERAGFRRDGVVENYASFKDGETTAWRYVWP